MDNRSHVATAIYGLVEGDFLGRLHRGWEPAEMDEVLGYDFFQCSARGGDPLPEYPAKVRALEPVRRRRYVEVGLHGHSIQLALITRNVLMSEEETSLDMVLNEAMNEEIFREPLNELLDVMYRLCRASEPIRPEASLVFFPSLLVVGISEQIHPQAGNRIHCLAQPYELLRPIFVELSKRSGAVINYVDILRKLDAVFGQGNVVQAHASLSSVVFDICRSQPSADWWFHWRSELAGNGGLGPLLGLVKYTLGHSDFSVHPEKFSTAVRPFGPESAIPTSALFVDERAATMREVSSRESLLSERRTQEALSLG